MSNKKSRGILGKNNVSPTEERKMNIILDEISISGSKMYSTKNIPDFNPDALVGKKGLQIYSQMREDDQIKAVLTMKKMAMLSTNWDIHAASEDPIDIEKRDFIKWNLDNLEGTLEDYLWNIFTAYDFGHSISEKNVYQIQKGRWAGKIGLKSIKTREPFYYSFESDEYGNLRENGIVFTGGTLKLPKSIEELGASSGSGTHLPTNKFIIYSYQKEFGNHFGKSDLRSSYRSWISKDILIRFYNIYMERFGMPTHVGTVPRGTSKADRDDLRTVLDRVQAKYAVVIPEDVKIELLRADAGGAEGYARAIELHNKFIARSILVPDLMGYTEMSSGGAFALGKKHFDMFLWIIKKGHRDVQETIMGEQLIKWLVDMNWMDTENYPKFKFESVTEEGSQAKAATIAQGIQTQFISPHEPWIRDYLGLPSKPSDIELPSIQTPSPIGVIPTEIEGRLQGLEEKVQEFREFREELRRKFHIGEYGEPKKTIVHFQNKKDKKKIEVKPSQFTKKMDYVEVKQSLDDYQDETVDALSEIVTGMRDDLVRRVRRKKIIENKDLIAINKLQVKYVGDFKRELEKRTLKLYVDGKIEAAKMLQKGGVDIEIVTKFQSVGDWEPVPPVDAIDFFKKKVLVKVKDKEGKKIMINMVTGEMLDYYTQKAFYIAGVEKEEILKQAKGSLLNSLKEGHSVDHAVANLGNVFDKYIERGELNDEGELMTAHRLETIVRTNFSESFNRGLRDFIDDKDITEFVPFWEYSAITDDRVRPLHLEMSGKIFREDDPIMEKIVPPNGFNCVPAGTLIKTDKGRIEIEKIEFGNLVLTHKGKYKKVIELHRNQYDGDLIEINLLYNDTKLYITPNHLVLTRNRGWIPAAELKIEDNVRGILGFSRIGLTYNEARNNKISETLKRKYASGERKSANLGKTKETSESIKRQSEKMKGRSVWNDGLTIEDERIRKRVESYKKFIEKFGSPLKGRTKETHEYIKRHSETMKVFWNLPENKFLKSESAKRMWKVPEIRESIIRNTIKSFHKRPTGIEREFIKLCEKHDLPYKYVGNGEVLIGGKNPDFINTNSLKIVIELYSKNHLGKFKPMDYERKRITHFLKYGYKVIFLTMEEDLLRQDWEKHCIMKIAEVENENKIHQANTV